MTPLTATQKKQLTDAFASAKSGVSAQRQNTPFPKPKVTQAIADVLDPWVAEPSGVQVEVAYDSMVTSDIIGLSFNGDDTFIPQNGSLFKKVTFTVPVADVAASVGKTVPVIYAVVRPDGTELSDFLNLEVQPLSQTRLPTPNITQAAAGVLDLNTFEGPANLVVPKWPLAVIGQRVWLTVSGLNGVSNVQLLTGYPITGEEVSSGIERDISRADLDKFADGDEMTMVCKVAFDGNNLESSATVFPGVAYTIKKLDNSVLPTVISVTDTKGLVANGGATYNTAVTLAGKASPMQQVQIFDGFTSVGTTAVNASGDWTQAVTALIVATHSITAKALYGTSPVSAAYIFTVAVPLSIDPSVMNLDGIVVKTSWPKTGLEFLGNTQTRQARGGVPPYTYTSNNPSIVTVSQNGEVIGVSNGTATITVQDALRATATYSVVKTNVYQLVQSPGAQGITAQQAIDWRNSMPGAITIVSGFAAMNRVYGPSANWPQPTGAVYWTCDPTGCSGSARVAFTPLDAVFSCRSGTSNLWLAWRLQPYP
ncbi:MULTISPECIES: Ig-like domain-containing protein [unclassified Pseudomonas]|uniref:Ig-like domain-containing protein n=1 Tax=unclassified Pseudomonas TaxID=196821 RepID=UPI002AC99FEB|nr:MULTISPECIES: Ig-like domain-containing protein [unclassified Pseudomonas]MEB0042039.1 Ig-like domain-containing protein [Pseudomonas sp. MH10]MEB0121396.1 Ig-like domain-containing protein [Pseudomonas sp. CCI1.2]WPX64136.1 Ig-like domain-containing protein [Pseudomonas sp. MH10]